MNHRVPDFELDEDYPIPTSSALARSKKSPMGEEDIMELLWQNGQVVVQSQNQRSLKRSHHGGDSVIPAEQPTREIRQVEEAPPPPPSHLFMQEDEMASWLHYPIDDDSSFDRDLYADLLYPGPSAEVRSVEVRTTPSVTATRPPIAPPPRRADNEATARFHNFMQFTKPKAKIQSGPSGSNKAVTSTVVDSSETPKSRASHLAERAAQVSGANLRCDTMSGGAAAAGTASGGGREAATLEQTVTSSPGGSGASFSASAEPVHKPTVMEDRKRKGREADEAECHSEDVEFESPDAKKQVHGLTPKKKSRAAEVHNLSERRRRDRINEKMKALQELIPRCNKSDKASMLDEAIEYLKSLQMQVQMMSMGCGMVPMMYPGVHHYMPPMGMGGMGIEMGMNRPMMQFPPVLPGSALPTSAAAAAHLGPRFPFPAFHMPHVPLPDPSRLQATNQSDPMLNSLGPQNSNQPRMPNFPDPYQQYFGLQQMQVPPSQSQAMMQPGTSKPSGSKRVENFENHQSG